MARRRYSFHRLAEHELENERRYYHREAKLGAAFLTAVDEACARMAEAPDRFTRADVVRGVTMRSVRVRRFPFRVFFGDLGDKLRVYAVAHDWTRRVGS